MDNKRPRILCIVDGPGWIFERHVNVLQKYLGNEFEFITHFRGNPYNENDFDLIYPLEFNLVTSTQILNPDKYVTGIRSFVAWADWELLSLVNYIVTHFRCIHVVSAQLNHLFSPYIQDVQYVTHGVETNIFFPRKPVSDLPGSLIIGWAGNRKTFVKGFREFIEPLANIPGVKLVYCGFSDRNLTFEDMPSFYDDIDVYVSASSFEGNNNSLLEAASMERAIITTTTGTVCEYLENYKSAIFVERDLPQFIKAVEYLRDNPAFRIMLGKNARSHLLKKGWDWGNKAQEYKTFFHRALNSLVIPAHERIIIDHPDKNHYIKILKLQVELLRDLRIGYAYQGIELQKELADTREQLARVHYELKMLKESIPLKTLKYLSKLPIIRNIKKAYLSKLNQDKLN